eukprot:GEMP01066656.1.p1 GENE.GEMP01066656.1~~GEMP01066656.1.p1  ORF type:complete len:322 (+),score=63.22 GEMP01066656.1:115-1080(+)
MIHCIAFLISCVAASQDAFSGGRHSKLHMFFLPPGGSAPPDSNFMSDRFSGQDVLQFEPRSAFSSIDDVGDQMPLEQLLNLMLPSPSVGRGDPFIDDIMKLMPIFDQDDHFHMLNHATHEDQCTKDVRHYCPRNQHRKNTSYFHCMARHRNKLSQACRDAIKETVPFVCAEMRELHCDGLETGILDCLARKKKELHPECRYAVEATQKTIARVNAAGRIHVVNSAGHHVHTFHGPQLPVWFFLVESTIFVIAFLILLAMYRHHSWMATILKSAGRKAHTELANVWAGGNDDDDNKEPHNGYRKAPSSKKDDDDSSYVYGTL